MAKGPRHAPHTQASRNSQQPGSWSPLRRRRIPARIRVEMGTQESHRIQRSSFRARGRGLGGAGPECPAAVVLGDLGSFVLEGAEGVSQTGGWRPSARGMHEGVFLMTGEHPRAEVRAPVVSGGSGRGCLPLGGEAGWRRGWSFKAGSLSVERLRTSSLAKAVAEAAIRLGVALGGFQGHRGGRSGAEQHGRRVAGRSWSTQRTCSRWKVGSEPEGSGCGGCGLAGAEGCLSDPTSSTPADPIGDSLGRNVHRPRGRVDGGGRRTVEFHFIPSETDDLFSRQFVAFRVISHSWVRPVRVRPSL